MNEEKIKACMIEIDEILKKYNCALKVDSRVVIASVEEAKPNGTTEPEEVESDGTLDQRSVVSKTENKE